MFKKIAVLLFALCLAACSTSTNNTSNEKEKKPQEVVITEDVQAIIDRGYLRVACKNDVPGFGYLNPETNTYEGMEIDIAYGIAAKIFDVSVEQAKEKELVHFEPVEVENRELVLTSDQVDYVIATYTITDARKEVVNFSDSYWKSSIGLMVNSNRTDDSTLSEERIRSVMDLDGKTIGVMTNSTTREDFIKYLQNHGIKISPRFVSYRTYDELSEELTRGNIDVFSVDVTILEGYMQEDRKILDDRFATQFYGVAASKDKEGLIEIANIVIDELD